LLSHESFHAMLHDTIIITTLKGQFNNILKAVTIVVHCDVYDFWKALVLFINIHFSSDISAPYVKHRAQIRYATKTHRDGRNSVRRPLSDH